MRNKQKPSRFDELCAAYERVRTDFTKYKRDCHKFSTLLVRQFIRYFEVPKSQFSLYKVDEENNFTLVLPAVVNAITHLEDAYFHFGIGLTVSPRVEKLPQELILIHIFVREDEHGKYFVRIARDPAEFEIDTSKEGSFDAFFDLIQKTVIKGYEEGFQKFIGRSTVRKLGYSVHTTYGGDKIGF